MPEERQGPEGDLTPLAAARAAHAALDAARRRIDDLNVYPVPDGDTGTNMALTAKAVRGALESAGDVPLDEGFRVATRAALMGARGNSGVILSQYVRGAAEALAADPTDHARALRSASEAAYASVREPVEGTILTVARGLADGAEATDGDLLGGALAGGEEALARTPEQLAVLREAGVVDAGGAGLLEAFRGVVAAYRGERLPEPTEAETSIPLEAIHRELSRYRYCTSLYVEGPDADPARLETELEALGDSLLVVGSPGAVKLHVHTDDPGRVLTLATALGEVEEVDIKNMHVQTVDREARLVGTAAAADVVAVVAGDGNARLFRSLGVAVVVEGGQSMNPAASELVEAVGRVATPEAILLPNNGNVVSAALQAGELAEKPVHVVPTRSLQAGLAAMVAFDARAEADANAQAMEAAADACRTGAVTRASRSAAVDGLTVAEGDYLGLVEGAAVAAGADRDVVARAVVERLLDAGADVLTVLVGEGAEPFDALRNEIAGARGELEIEVHEGGQPHYALLFSAE